MEVRLLKKEYLKGDQIYIDFCNDKINNGDNFTEEFVSIDKIPDFPIYMADKKISQKYFFEAFDVISSSYLSIDRSDQLNDQFWYSLLCVYKRDYIIDKYPKVLEDLKEFNKIVLKKFDWENYIYKSVIAAQYISDYTTDLDERNRYYKLITNNLDVYNYIIKYNIFRNDQFLINILDIIDENDISEKMKAKLKNRPDLGKDERVGRRVIYELNKSYPVVLSPFLSKEELELLVLDHLKLYME